MYYFFELLKEARKEKNYSQRKLAETLGVSQNAVCGWESGKRQPRLEMVKRIAKALNIDLDMLLDPVISEYAHTYTGDTSEHIRHLIARVKADFSLTDTEKECRIADLSLQHKIANEVGYTLAMQRLADQGYSVYSEGDRSPFTLPEIAEEIPLSIEFNTNDYSEDELREIKDFADFIKSRRKTEAPGSDRPPAEPPANEEQPPAGADPRQGNAQDNNQDNE